MHASDAGQLFPTRTHPRMCITNQCNLKSFSTWTCLTHRCKSTSLPLKLSNMTRPKWQVLHHGTYIKLPGSPSPEENCIAQSLPFCESGLFFFFFYQNHSFYQEKSILRYWILFILKSLTLIADLGNLCSFWLQRSFLKLRDSCDMIFQEKQKILHLLYRKSNLFNIAEISFMIFRCYGRTKKLS